MEKEMARSASLGQIAKLISLLDQKDVDFKRLGMILADGVLADIFDRDAQIAGRREYVRAALGLDPKVKMFRDIKLTNNVQSLKRRLREVDQAYFDHLNVVFKDLWERVARLRVPAATLVFMTVADLGLPDKTWYEDVCQQGLQYGFWLCPPQIGVQLSTQKDQFADWPYGEDFHVMMEPLVDDGMRYFFSSSRTHQPWLGTRRIPTQGLNAGRPLDAGQHVAFLVKTPAIVSEFS